MNSELRKHLIDTYMDSIGCSDFVKEDWDSLTGVSMPSHSKIGQQRIYVDMDGVLAKWVVGTPYEEVMKPGYFESLPPNQNMVDFVSTLCNLHNFDVHILSKSAYHAIAEKMFWLSVYLPDIPLSKIHFVPLIADKKNFVEEPTVEDILIDDYNPNLDNWDGIAIKCITECNNENPKYLSIYNENSAEDNLRILLSQITLRVTS